MSAAQASFESLKPALEVGMLTLTGVLVVFGLYHLLLGIGGWSAVRRRPPPMSPFSDAARADDAPLVTFLVTAYRERAVLFDCLSAILAQRYPEDRCRVVLLADEDDEGTLDAIRAFLAGPDTRVARNAEGDEVLESPRVTAILQTGDRAGRGKPRALQNAMRYVPREGYLAILDADHVVAPDFVGRCLTRFEDPRVAIVQAKRYPKERPRRWLSRWDVLEQNVGQIQALLARDRIGCANFYGSTAMLRADLVHDVGWQNCLAEDTMLNYDLRERGHRIAYEPSTGSAEDHVTSLRAFILQRRRWAAGHMQVLFAKLAALRRARAPRIERWESFLTLNYYNATLVVLAYWLVRTTHYWLQQPAAPMRLVVAASLLAGIFAMSFERRAGGDATARMRGAVVATAIGYGLVTLVVSYAVPAPTPAPVPPWLEVAMFFSPIAQMALGYANPAVRPRSFRGLDHVRNALALVALAPVMLVVNAYATLTGILVSLEGPRVSWVKTARKTTRRHAASRS